MSQEIIKKTGEIIAQNHSAPSYGVIALIDEHGHPTASTISVAKNDGINWITFCVGTDENKANRIAKNNRASVCFSSETYNITLVGTAEILTGQADKDEMWYDNCKHIWPEGPTSPDFAVLRFKTERYNIFGTVGEQHITGVL
ncbi:MAG: pyridoxamine 5'-phosphate oxidase family protein [Defluviitaleaceae bacterium]|nr:pyridoxamine 5'-phosphate oxidase family protein [Defluviitaleaceae bacterium]